MRPVYIMVFVGPPVLEYPHAGLRRLILAPLQQVRLAGCSFFIGT